MLGCLASDVFRPWLLKVQGHLERPDGDALFWMNVAQSATTVFGFVAGISDVFLYLARVDITLISLAVTVATDWYLNWLLATTRRGPFKGGGDADDAAPLLVADVGRPFARVGRVGARARGARAEGRAAGVQL